MTVKLEWIEIPAGPAIIGMNRNAVRQQLREQYNLNDPHGHFESAVEKAALTWTLRDEGKLGVNEFVALSQPEQDIVQQYESLFHAEMDLARQQDEHTEHIPQFYISQYPVTVQQVGWVNKRTQCQLATRNPIREQILTFPAELDYQNAEKLVNCLGVRLPTEAEWEKAARGPDGQLYPWGDEFNSHFGNFMDSYSRPRIPEPRRKYMRFGKTPVNNFKENVSVYGVCDTAGNVREWTSDRVQQHTVIKSNAARTAVPQIVEDYYENIVRVHNQEPYWYYNLSARRELVSRRGMAMFIGVRLVREQWEVESWTGVDLPASTEENQEESDE